MTHDPRQLLERLCVERKEDFRALSRMLGRNTSYIQQFVRRGVPKRLGEDERRKLARYFGVPEKLFGGSSHDDSAPNGLIGIPRYFERGFKKDEASHLSAKPYFAFDATWVNVLRPGKTPKLAVLRMEGDAMAPTLNAGDDVLVDLADVGESLRDGVYALEAKGQIMIRRVAINPIALNIDVRSDNQSYPDWPGCRRNDVNPIGRVVWFGRCVP